MLKRLVGRICFEKRGEPNTGRRPAFRSDVIRDAGEENGSEDLVGHQEMRDRLAATIVRYNALIGVHAATHQRV
jgi:hypothetical protein